MKSEDTRRKLNLEDFDELQELSKKVVTDGSKQSYELFKLKVDVYTALGFNVDIFNYDLDKYRSKFE